MKEFRKTPKIMTKRATLLKTGASMALRLGIAYRTEKPFGYNPLT
jgi:hypothetical protein